MSQQFCLKWNNHMNNMMEGFKNLLSTEAMVDVTLACDGLSLKAHKVVLSACSPFFQSLFLENPCKHPIVILKDMKYTELKAIVQFMYHGEVNVAQDQLSALMKTAETLKVKGLAEETNDKNQLDDESSKSAPRADSPPPKRKKGKTRKRAFSVQSDDTIFESNTTQPDSDIEEISSDIITHNTAYSTSSTVPVQSYPSSIHKSQQMQQQQPVESFVSDENYSVVSPKFMQQSLTTDDLSKRSGQSSVHSTASTVPLQSRTSSFHKSQQVQQQQPDDESFASGEDYSIESPTFMQQSFTDALSKQSGRSSVQSNIELPRRSQSTTDRSNLLPVTSTPLSSTLAVANQQTENPPDIKPVVLDLEPMSPPMSVAAGPSHSTDENYMDQSNMSTMSEPGSSQDESAIEPTNSQPKSCVTILRIKCKTCKKSFSAETTLLRHRIWHHKHELPRFKYNCSLCPYASDESTSFKRHHSVHETHRKYCCHVCGNRFLAKHSLGSHMIIHTGEKHCF